MTKQQKNITTFSLIGSLLIILASFDIGRYLLLFLIEGTLPGTSMQVSPTIMLIGIGLISFAVVGRLIVVPILRATKKLPSPRLKRA
jgi:divalent metal cation (Fe/Co/Zn/Cd) transporter